MDLVDQGKLIGAAAGLLLDDIDALTGKQGIDRDERLELLEARAEVLNAFVKRVLSDVRKARRR